MNPTEKMEKLLKIRSQYPKFMRNGQCLMNALFNVDEMLYQKIYKTEADCFYDDSKCEKFMETITAYWNNEK
jgi:hypothetical protein